jgi:Cu/Zn superoxide dismutase
MKKNVNEKSTSIVRSFLLITGTFIALFIVLLFTGCNDDDNPDPGSNLPDLTGNSVTYSLVSSAGSGVNGTVIFAETTKNTTLVTFSITGGTPGGVHPVHIHQNSKIEGGGIVISLGDIDGSTGKLEVEVESMDDDNTISYDDLVDFDGHINIHKSPSDLSNIVAFTDIGENELTGQQEDYELFGKIDPSVKGEVLFQERKSGETLITVKIEDYNGTEDLPNHIHANNVVDGGPIVISLNPVDVSSGIGITNVSHTDDDTPITYGQLKEFDGHFKAHKSESELQTVIVQGDIGQNELTSDSEEYELKAKTGDNVSGTATFTRRRNDETLVTLVLNNTQDGNNHPAHIHNNTAAEGGGISIDLSSVDGTRGMSLTNVTELNDGTAISYDDLIEIDGYINVHLSGSQLQTIVSQGDVGQNVLTGNSESYGLSGAGGSGVSGTVSFFERKNETTLVEISLTGTSETDTHPAHIHANDVLTGGGIIIGLNAVNGATGKSLTQVEFMDDNTPITYDEMTAINGHVNVHKSTNDFSVVANGNVGDNAN